MLLHVYSFVLGAEIKVLLDCHWDLFHSRCRILFFTHWKQKCGLFHVVLLWFSVHHMTCGFLSCRICYKNIKSHNCEMWNLANRQLPTRSTSPLKFIKLQNSKFLHFLNALFHNVKGSENKFLCPPLCSDQCQKKQWVLSWLKSRPSTKFQGNLFSSFYINLLTNNRQ